MRQRTLFAQRHLKNVTSLQSVELAYCFTYGNISTIDASAF